MSDISERLAEIGFTIIRKLRAPPAEMFPAVGILAFLASGNALSKTGLWPQLQQAISGPPNLSILVFLFSMLLLACLYGFASFVELGIARERWPEFLPEPAFFHIFFAVFLSSFFALLCFLAPNPKMATIGYVVYSLVDWVGNLEVRQMTRQRIKLKASSTAKKYESVAFRATKQYFVERPMNLAHAVKLAAALASMFVAWFAPRPELGYLVLCTFVLGNEALFWYWRLIFARANEYWFQSARG